MRRVRSASRVRLSKQDITDPHRHRWKPATFGATSSSTGIAQEIRGEVATGTDMDFVEAKLPSATSVTPAKGRERYLVEPNIQGGQRRPTRLQSSEWIGQIRLSRRRCRLISSSTNVLTRDECQERLPRRPEAFFVGRAGANILARIFGSRAGKNDCPSTCSRELAARMGFTGDNPRRAVEAS